MAGTSSAYSHPSLSPPSWFAGVPRSRKEAINTYTRPARGYSHLYDGLTEEDHFFSYLLYYEILDLEPFFTLAGATSGTQLNFPHRVFFISSGASYGLMDYVCDKVIDSGRMVFC